MFTHPISSANSESGLQTLPTGHLQSKLQLLQFSSVSQIPFPQRGIRIVVDEEVVSGTPTGEVVTGTVVLLEVVVVVVISLAQKQQQSYGRQSLYPISHIPRLKPRDLHARMHPVELEKQSIPPSFKQYFGNVVVVVVVVGGHTSVLLINML